MQARSLKHSSVAILAACLALAASSAMAETITVSAHVADSCIIATTPMIFGNYDSLGANGATGNDLTTTSTVSATCTNGSSPKLKLDEGVNKDSGSNPAAPERRMLHGTADYLNYNLYTDDNYGTVLEGVTGVALTADGASHDTTIYGKVPKNQPLPVGDYTDTVTVTVSF